ncbi:MAG: lytic transglycosylase domain-containing protein [Candidatus Aegiribacteria sp.]|nr:lytic transglycosylase domain-containing protein [Candidatus Aegiribacteria sp.]
MFRLLLLLLTVSLPLMSASLQRADSFILSGMNERAVSELLELLREDDIPQNVILYRLAGLYHAVGREDDCIELLDSIGQESGENLYGWKVSLLDLSRRSDEALALVPPDDILLRLWLQRESGEVPASGILPAPDCLAERAVRALICTDGRMSKGQMEQTVLDAALLGFLGDEVIDELEISLETEGPWWDGIAVDLSLVHESGRLDRLSAARDMHLVRGSAETWESRLDLGDEVSLTAALMLLRIDPDKWGRSWLIADILAGGGRISLADSIAAASHDISFATGVSMAILRETAQHGQLLALCDSIPPDMPDSLCARAALFRARALRALQRPPDEFYGSYLAYAHAYPWDDKASEAAYLAARYFDSERNWPAAADAYMAALSSGDFGAARAHWRGGFCHYMCGRGSTGDSIWTAGIEKYPFSAWCDEMLFWKARYANRIGDAGRESELLLETAGRHPWEFYGLLAAERTGSDYLRIEAPEINLLGNAVTAEALDMMSRGYGSMASSMLSDTELSGPETSSAALSLMGCHHSTLTLLRALDFQLRSGNIGILPENLLSFYFPAPYRELTQSTVAGLDIPQAIVTGLMRQESYFSRWARSWVGASGLIQLMPGTAGDIARWYGLPVLSGSDFFVPEKSIQYGSLYLARQFSAFNGSSVLALAAYNAGPGNAAKWMEAFPLEEDDPELFIEQIPLTETRGYVKHVMANTWIYSELFN